MLLLLYIEGQVTSLKADAAPEYLLENFRVRGYDEIKSMRARRRRMAMEKKETAAARLPEVLAAADGRAVDSAEL